MPRRPRTSRKKRVITEANGFAGTDSAGSGGLSSVFDAFKGFTGWNRETYEQDGGHNATLGASIFAMTDSSKKVFPGDGSPLMKKKVDSTGKDTGDEENAVSMKALNVAYLDEIETKQSSRKMDTKESTTAKPATSGFMFGSVAQATTTNTAVAPSPAAAKIFNYRFGSTSSTTGTGFSFANVAKPTKDSKPDEKATADDDEDESSKVEFTPVKEKYSIFSKRCKLFVKSDSNYSDSGIGTLHIKKVDVKGQVLVRADTSIGQILLNIILNEAVPVSRGMGKNNVMMMCVPTPETKPPPTSVLLRVKTGKEADELYVQIRSLINSIETQTNDFVDDVATTTPTTASLETSTTLQYIRRPLDHRAHAREHHPRAVGRRKPSASQLEAVMETTPVLLRAASIRGEGKKSVVTGTESQQ
ncbi:nucleoporin [Culex quinquefasciatus]|uniref:Nucleoporin n=1 Tax=Culex quinquefasciatus TaxID=7176 RepID=B0XJZ7_CULQU|nr:nucleoporin [Culex quinquefasciatus]|eukprot:XP_001869969.1 nucleoporin [Culex quinquefasciatus]